MVGDFLCWNLLLLAPWSEMFFSERQGDSEDKLNIVKRVRIK